MPKRELYDAQDAVKLLEERRIATLAELKGALGTRVDVTVFRRLKPLGYSTSYSHRGKYYTLDSIAEFDDRGLWSFNGVGFSKDGTLLSTAERLVCEARAGYVASELKEILGVGVKEALVGLVRRGRLTREPIAGVYLYCSPDPPTRRRQIMERGLREAQTGFHEWATSDETKAALVLFVSLLDEKQRRLYAGLESLRLGRGGDRKIARLIGMDVHTVARGRRQLLERDIEVERVRAKGGGRKRVEKKRPK